MKRMDSGCMAVLELKSQVSHREVGMAEDGTVLARHKWKVMSRR